MKTKRIGVDIDGVLADFNRGFISLLYEITGRQLVPLDYQPATWHWPQAVGYTNKDIDAAWRYIEVDPLFWRALHSLPHTEIFLLALERSGHDVYFCTARPGMTAKKQTEDWLKAWFRLPTVLITSEKGLAARTLGLSVYVDDRAENCHEVATTGAHVYMPRRGYNAEYEDVVGVTRIDSLLEFLDRESIPYNERMAAAA